MTTTTLPAGAVEADDWEVNRDGSVTRMFDGTKRGERVRVDIVGQQDYAGAVLWRVGYVWTHGVELDAAALRELAADASAAADELDRLGS